MRRVLLPLLVLLPLQAGCGGGGDEAVVDGAVLTIEAIQEPSTRGPEAAQVRRAFAGVAAAGLEATRRRDRLEVCEQLRCVARTASDQVTITFWPDDATAERVADRSVGRLGVTFASGEVAADERDDYLEAIRRGLRR